MYSSAILECFQGLGLRPYNATIELVGMTHHICQRCSASHSLCLLKVADSIKRKRRRGELKTERKVRHEPAKTTSEKCHPELKSTESGEV